MFMIHSIVFIVNSSHKVVQVGVQVQVRKGGSGRQIEKGNQKAQSRICNRVLRMK